MSEGEQTYGSISLIGRGAPAPGAVRLDRDKISWKKTGGGRTVDVGADEIEAMTYAQVPGGVVVTVRRRGDKDAVRLKGFRGSDLAGLKDLCSAFYGVSLAKTEAQINGRNWGEVSVNKSAIGFAVDGKDAFEVATKDIAAVSLATKHEVVMEFHLDDVAQQSSKDALVEMSFYVPPTSNEWGVAARTEDSNVNEDEDERTGAKNLQDAILAVADVAADTGTPIAEFESVSLIAPRGKVAVELHAQFMRLTGAAADFKINYAALQRVFLLPKPNSAQTYAVMHLDPPIRKGQTFYAHIVAQFNQNEELEIEPDADEETRAKFPNLEDGVYEGPSGDVFVRLLKAVGGCKLTRQGTFTAADGGHAVKAANKAEVGHLFPLEKSFFYLPKPSTLLHYADVESVEFERHSGPHAAATQRTFDVAVSMRAGATHTFHGIPKSEFQNLVNFLTAKHLKISNVDANARADALIDDDDEEDHHAQRLRSEVDEDGHGGSDSEEDEDFAAGSESDSGGEPTDESESDSDGDDGSDGSDDAAPAAKKAKKAKTAKPAKKAPAKKAKKDPNAPKRPLSSYMIFAGEARASVVAENPGASIGEVGKALGARWKAFSAEEKAPFEAKAKEAKEKYQEAMKAYEAE
jgi:structure-specific recognition protein 1